MNIVIFLSIASLLGIIYLILGIRAARQVKTESDYYVAGRSLGILPITCNLIATQLGGGMLLGTAAAAYTQGLYGLEYTLGMSLGFLLLAGGIASRLQQGNVTTTAQLFETRYHSITLKKIASLLSIATMFGILIAQVVGFKSLLAGVGVADSLFVACMWLLVVVYTMIGGLRAITINDMVQLAIITTVFTALFIYSLWYDPLSVSSLISTMHTQVTAEQNSSLLFATIAMPALFSLFQQDLAQRFFASRSPAVAAGAALNASVFLIVFAFIPVYFGMKARVSGMTILPGHNPLITLLESYTNDWVFALVLCAIIAAIISTADALINAVSANITQDFNLNVGHYNALRFSKLITLSVGCAALGASYMVPLSIIELIIGSYALSVSCLLVPLLICYFKADVKKEAAFGAITLGFVGFVVGRWCCGSLPKEIVALALSLVGYWVGDWYGKKKF